MVKTIYLTIYEEENGNIEYHTDLDTSNPLNLIALAIMTKEFQIYNMHYIKKSNAETLYKERLKEWEKDNKPKLVKYFKELESKESAKK